LPGESALLNNLFPSKDPSTLHNPVFEVEGIKFGLEICADHGQGKLAMYTKNVDVHLISSHGQCKQYTLAPNGITVQCDAGETMTGYYSKENPHKIPCTNSVIENGNGTFNVLGTGVQNVTPDGGRLTAMSTSVSSAVNKSSIEETHSQEVSSSILKTTLSSSIQSIR